MSTKAKTWIGVALVAVLLYFILRPSPAAAAAPAWNEKVNGQNEVGVFGLDWG